MWQASWVNASSQCSGAFGPVSMSCWARAAIPKANRFIDSRFVYVNHMDPSEAPNLRSIQLAGMAQTDGKALGAILCNCQGAIEVLKPLGLEDNVFLSFLPLSHAYEHSGGQFFPISIGAQIYYAEGANTLVQYLAEAKPTSQKKASDSLKKPSSGRHRATSARPAAIVNSMLMTQKRLLR